MKTFVRFPAFTISLLASILGVFVSPWFWAVLLAIPALDAVNKFRRLWFLRWLTWPAIKYRAECAILKSGGIVTYMAMWRLEVFGWEYYRAGGVDALWDYLCEVPDLLRPVEDGGPHICPRHGRAFLKVCKICASETRRK